MYKINTDIKKNRLYLDLRDIEPSEIQWVLEELEAACSRLAEGFASISLFPKVDVSIYKEEDRILKAQETILLHNPGLVIRVVGKKQDPVDRHHMETLSLKHGYPVEYVESLAAAEKILEEYEQRSRRGAAFAPRKSP